jgi:ribosome-associated translation inhibitor RaiA
MSHRPQIRVKGLHYHGKDRIGDSEWMLKLQDTGTRFKQRFVYIFNENVKDSDSGIKGGGSASARPWTKKSNPTALGLPTGWSVESGGFKEMSIHVRKAIDTAFLKLELILQDDQSIQYVFFSCSDDDPTQIGSSIFRINDNVLNYINEKLRNFERYYNTKYSDELTWDDIHRYEESLREYATLASENAELKAELRAKKRKMDFERQSISHPLFQHGITKFMKQIP